MTRATHAERTVFLSTLPPSNRDYRFALGIVLVSLVIFLLAVPFAKRQLAEVWAFIPSYQSALMVTDLITAVLLFAQFVILGAPQLLVLAGGYLFCALITIPHALSYPRLFATTGLLHAGPQTTAWLYMIWHGGFPLAVAAFVLLRDRATIRRRGVAVALTCSAVLVIVGAATALSTAGHDLLPAIMRGDQYTPVLPVVTGGVWLLSLMALLLLWKRRPHSALDLWLMVVMAAWLLDIALSAMLNHGRFDLGFYLGRVYGLVAASLVLLVILVETGGVYARLARSYELERMEHERQLYQVQSELIHVARLTELGQMVAALAHEVNQPLTAVATYVSAGMRLLRGNDPAKAEDAFQKAAEQVTRASQVIQRLRNFVKKDDGNRTSEDIRRTIEEAVALALLGPEGRKVRLEMDFAPDTPLVLIDKVRVQQVLLNLIRNAVEAMQGRPERDLAIRAIQAAGDMVEISVTDTGPGLSAEVRAKLFQPFVTTKSSGMGVGLSICHSIIEGHGGLMWLVDTAGGGAEFHFTLPAVANGECLTDMAVPPTGAA